MAATTDLPAYPRLMHAALDATDGRALAEFYRELLGLHYRPGDDPADPAADPSWLVLLDGVGRRVLAVQQVDELAAATWPEPAVPMQLHLDFAVANREELERHRVRAEALGARVLLDRTAEEAEPLYVFGDPAGHPFCVLVAPDPG